MPAATESVLVQRIKVLASDESALQKDIKSGIDSLGNVRYERERNDLLGVVQEYVAKANPVVFAEGGSEFTYLVGTNGADIGVGNYKSRSIWYVEQPLDALKKRLAENRDLTEGVTNSVLGDVTVYQTKVSKYGMNGEEVVPIEESLLVALPSDRCVVITEDAREMEQILAGLKSSAAELPRKWQAAASNLDLESPIVLLRCYDLKNELDAYSPTNPSHCPSNCVSVDSVALVLPSARQVSLRMNCISNEPQKVVAFFNDLLLSQDEYRWKTTFDATGFEAEIVVMDDQREKAHSLLSLYALFGPNVFI
ncbi:MAG TPA: hypothetical protein PKN33_15115 [Phycisphaerae bacterium]|nr:hypothetical protein [Phycisphaerae bacterium]